VAWVQFAYSLALNHERIGPGNPTPCADYAVADVINHLAFSFEMAAVSVDHRQTGGLVRENSLLCR